MPTAVASFPGHAGEGKHVFSQPGNEATTAAAADAAPMRNECVEYPLQATPQREASSLLARTFSLDHVRRVPLAKQSNRPFPLVDIASRWSSAVTVQREGSPECEGLMVAPWQNGSDFDVTMWMTYLAWWVVMSFRFVASTVTHYCE